MRSLRSPLNVVRLLLGLLLLLGAGTALAQDEELLPVTEAYQLRADVATPGVVKLHWTIAPDYYLYRGRMKFTAGEGVTLGAAQLPDGEKSHDEYLGDVETYHHGVDATIPYTLAPGATRLKLAVQYQGCHEVDPKICYPPHTEHLDLPLPATALVTPAAGTPPGAGGNPLGAALGALDRTTPAPVGAALPAEQAFRFEALASSPQQLLLRWSMPPGYYLYRAQTVLKLRDGGGLRLGEPTWPAGVSHADPQFGQVTVYFDQLELPVPLIGAAQGGQVTLEASFQGCQDGGLCYPVMTRTVNIDLGTAVASAGAADLSGTEAPPAGNGTRTGFLAALLLALGGGLVLNLMPCVLPVLSIKAMGVLESGADRRSARRHALFYTAGVLVSFAALGLGILALRAAGHTLGWGSQLQQPVLVGVLACVMLAVGLAMSGVVHLGASLANTGSGLASRQGASGDFFTGVLAVVVASPCTAPFMGGALAYAFAASMPAALGVFLALGLGLALPFLLIGFVPALARRLPRPGRWMETLKQLLAFPMYLTAVWLVWVLARQRGPDAVALVLVAMVLLALTLWWFERSRGHALASRVLVAVFAASTLAPLYLLARVPPPTATVAAAGSVAYSAQKLAALRAAGTPVFVDMTADWCVTCKANEHAVLDTAAFRDLLARTGAVYMRGDWTNVDPAISAFLAQYNSPGVPLYVVYPADGGAGQRLSTVLTPGMVDAALTAAARLK